jgi:N6-adenosine-specific RNA methylase IME4
MSAPSEKTLQKQAGREQRERELAARILALPGKRYGVILADAGWRFEPWSRETGMDRAADNHYATSTTETIKAMDVVSIAADDCALFLWATSPMMRQALEVMMAWGFAYKSQIVWDKEIAGTGYWFRNRHELLLVGTRGNIPAPAMDTQWPSVMDERRTAHSVKPEWAYELIEEYFPNLPKIELFARRARAGWSSWGCDAPVRDAAE